MSPAADSSSEETGAFDYDVLVVGSGFGASVSALRLSEKGYRVGVLEAGRRFGDRDFAKTSWDVRRFLWAPALRCFGIQRIDVLPDVMVLSGSGVGGGSLNYANTLYRPLEPFYDDPQWGGITDWRSELAPYYEQAERMLGAAPNPTMTPADEEMLRVATEMGVGDTFRLATVGVCFGSASSSSSGGAIPGSAVPDPYFGGVGPSRNACIQCGECMTGCRHGAKNTLVKNYLYLAEQAGAEVHPLTTVVALAPRRNGGWLIHSVPSGKRRGGRGERIWTASQVVLGAGTLGTQRLLHTMVSRGLLPHLSRRLGELTRTNSEALVGATAPLGSERNFTSGVAITSSFYPEPGTHVEPVRYGKGSNAMGLLATLLVDGGGRLPRWVRFAGVVARHPGQFVRSLSVKRWSERTVIGLVMQPNDTSLTLYAKDHRGKVKISSKPGAGTPNPTWIPAAHDVVRRLASNISGIAGGTWGDVFNIPMTAHFLGGCVIGESPDAGVIDPWHRVYGYDGLHVVDGSSVSANPGANPSLTITALAERAMSFWPTKGSADPRPPVGSRYGKVSTVFPASPVVPEAAPGALKI